MERYKYDWRHEKRALIFRRHNSQKATSKIEFEKSKSRDVNPEIVLLAVFDLHFLYLYIV